MPRRLILLALIVSGALTSIHLTGCTAIGFGVGAMVDSANGKQTAGGLSRVRTGTDITMWLRDGRKLHGQFLGSRDSLSETPLPTEPTGGKRTVAPVRAVVILGTKSGTQQIPIQDVDRVSVPDARGKTIGTLIGLAGDALLIFIAYMAAGAAY